MQASSSSLSNISVISTALCAFSYIFSRTSDTYVSSGNMQYRISHHNIKFSSVEIWSASIHAISASFNTIFCNFCTLSGIINSTNLFYSVWKINIRLLLLRILLQKCCSTDQHAYPEVHILLPSYYKMHYNMHLPNLPDPHQIHQFVSAPARLL